MARFGVLLLIIVCTACSSESRTSNDATIKDLKLSNEAITADLAKNLPDRGAMDVLVIDTVIGHRYYEYNFPNCASGGLFNCKPSLELCSDGAAIIMVTDIVNSGTYTETTNSVITHWTKADVPDTIVFTWTNNRQALEDDVNGWTWNFVANPPYPKCK